MVGRKEGQNVYYSVRDPEIFRLLDVARRIFNNQLIDVRDLLAQLNPIGREVKLPLSSPERTEAQLHRAPGRERYPTGTISVPTAGLTLIDD